MSTLTSMAVESQHGFTRELGWSCVCVWDAKGPSVSMAIVRHPLRSTISILYMYLSHLLTRHVICIHKQHTHLALIQ